MLRSIELAVKKRSIHVVNSWTRNHERWTRVGFVHLEFTARDGGDSWCANSARWL